MVNMLLLTGKVLHREKKMVSYKDHDKQDRGNYKARFPSDQFWFLQSSEVKKTLKNSRVTRLETTQVDVAGDI